MQRGHKGCEVRIAAGRHGRTECARHEMVNEATSHSTGSRLQRQLTCQQRRAVGRGVELEGQRAARAGKVLQVICECLRVHFAGVCMAGSLAQQGGACQHWGAAAFTPKMLWRSGQVEHAHSMPNQRGSVCMQGILSPLSAGRLSMRPCCGQIARREWPPAQAVALAAGPFGRREQQLRYHFAPQLMAMIYQR